MKLLSPPLGWGVLGCGQIAWDKTIPGILADGHSRLVAVADTMPERRALASGLDPAPRVYETMEALLADSDVDAVYIALPTFYHAKAVSAAAKAGKHVLCEKPLCLDAEEASQLRSACAKANVNLMTAYMSRFGDAFQKSVELCKSGELGTLCEVSARFSYDAVQAYPLNSPGGWRWTDTRGGGPLMDIGVYMAFAIRELLDECIGEVSAISAQRRMKDVPQQDSYGLWFKSSSGIPGLLSVGFTHNECRIDVFGDKGSLSIINAFSQGPQGKVIWNGQSGNGELDAEKSGHSHYENYAREIAHFSSQVLAGQTPEPTADDAVADMEFLDAARLSAREGRIVRIGRAAKT